MHAHTHHPVPTQRISRAFRIGIALNFAFVVIEAGAGLWANSLALRPFGASSPLARMRLKSQALPERANQHDSNHGQRT